MPAARFEMNIRRPRIPPDALALTHMEAAMPPATHPRSVNVVIDKAEHLRTLTSLAVARYGLVVPFIRDAKAYRDLS